jgi:hypothetical protein
MDSHLRNVVDSINLQKEGFFSEHMTFDLKPEIVNAIRSKLKLHPVRIHKCENFWLYVNIFLFSFSGSNKNSS